MTAAPPLEVERYTINAEAAAGLLGGMAAFLPDEAKPLKPHRFCRNASTDGYRRYDLGGHLTRLFGGNEDAAAFAKARIWRECGLGLSETFERFSDDTANTNSDLAEMWGKMLEALGYEPVYATDESTGDTYGSGPVALVA